MSARTESILRVLQLARQRIVTEGWQAASWERTRDNDYRPRPLVGPWSLFDAVRHGQASDYDAMVGVWYARHLLNLLSRSALHEWDAVPFRQRGDAVRLLDAALATLGVKRPHRGGWRVTAGGKAVA